MLGWPVLSPDEKTNRRKPGKKELYDLTGEPTLDLLPMVFASG
ncbi:hypothetical protein CTR2_R17480 [Comamonas thiooxydans]|nr:MULTISPECIES: hypothetical protein [Comamonas]BDR08410.1 hypothetical protein CTR2_R17480 [Comamonas thiooxydans]